MVVVVLAAQVVDVAGSDQRSSQLSCDSDDPLVGPLLFGDPVLLHLEVHVLGPKCVHELVRVSTRIGGAALKQQLAEARLQAARERDDSFGVGGYLLEVNRRLAALESLQKAARAELDEVAIAGRGGGQQGQVKALEPPRHATAVIVDEVDLAADDRLDSM